MYRARKWQYKVTNLIGYNSSQNQITYPNQQQQQQNEHQLQMTVEYGYPVQTREPPPHKHFMYMALYDAETSDATNAAIQLTTDIGEWLVDSGATNHYTSKRNILQDFREIDTKTAKTCAFYALNYLVG